MFKIPSATADKNQNQSDPQMKNMNDFPIHTMKSDLEEIKNPAMIKIDAQDYSTPIKYTPPTNLNDKQKSSPFLNPIPQPEKSTEPIKTAPQAPTPIKVMPQARPVISRPVIKETVPTKATEKPINNGSKVSHRKTFAMVFIALLLMVIAGGVYYFWPTRQIAPVQEEIVAPIATPIIEEPVTEPAVTFSENKLNYIQINSTQDAAAIQSVIEEYGIQIALAKPTTPIEFIITDENNSPLDFKVFASRFGFALPQTIINHLDTQFSLFIVSNTNDSGYRIGIAISIKPENSLKNILRKEEARLIDELKPLFIMSFGNPIDTTFKSSTYKNIAIRYRNIQADVLSLDYAIVDKKLLIGTTKTSLRSIIDYVILAKSALNQ